MGTKGIGTQLSHYRERRKLSVEELTEAIQAKVPPTAKVSTTGEPLTLDSRTVSRWLQGAVQPRALYRIAIEHLLADN